MKLLSWNVRKKSGPDTTSVVASIDPDVAVLTECLHSDDGLSLDDRLTGDGWHVAHNMAVSRRGAVLIASKSPIGNLAAVGYRTAPERMLSFDVDGLRILAVYLEETVPKGPERDWEAMRNHLVETAAGLVGESTVITGDLNLGDSGSDISHPEKKLTGSGEYAALLEQGWVDSFRLLHGDRSEFSYFSYGWKHKIWTGWRIDHTLVTPDLVEAVQRSEYLHEVDGKLLVRSEEHPDGDAVSDHAAMVTELEL